MSSAKGATRSSKQNALPQEPDAINPRAELLLGLHDELGTAHLAGTNRHLQPTPPFSGGAQKHRKPLQRRSFREWAWVDLNYRPHAYQA